MINEFKFISYINLKIIRFKFKLLRSHFEKLLAHLDDHGLYIFTLRLEHLYVLVVFLAQLLP